MFFLQNSEARVPSDFIQKCKEGVIDAFSPKHIRKGPGIRCIFCPKFLEWDHDVVKIEIGLFYFWGFMESFYRFCLRVFYPSYLPPPPQPVLKCFHCMSCNLNLYRLWPTKKQEKSNSLLSKKNFFLNFTSECFLFIFLFLFLFNIFFYFYFYFYFISISISISIYFSISFSISISISICFYISLFIFLFSLSLYLYFSETNICHKARIHNFRIFSISFKATLMQVKSRSEKTLAELLKKSDIYNKKNTFFCKSLSYTNVFKLLWFGMKLLYTM